MMMNEEKEFVFYIEAAMKMEIEDAKDIVIAKLKYFKNHTLLINIQKVEKSKNHRKIKTGLVILLPLVL